MLTFRAFSLNDRALFEKLCAQYPSSSCERCFSTSYVWRIFFDYRVADWEGRLAIFEKSNGWLMYPLGAPTPPEMLSELIRKTRECGFCVSAVYDVPPDYLEMFPNAEDFFRIQKEEKYFDYLYPLENLSELKGQILRKKRNHIKHFMAENPNWKVEEIDDSNMSQARHFMESMEYNSETAAISSAFDNFKLLNFGGIVLRDNSSKIVAAAIFGKINDEVYDINFEKSDKSCDGAAQMIVKAEADALIARGAKMMNREQDMGLENLRRAKKSLDPIMFERLTLVPVDDSFCIRKIDAVDAYVVRRLSELYLLSGWSEKPLEEQDIESDAILKNSYCCFGAFDGDNLVGFFRAFSDGASDAYLLDLFVREQYRGRGIAKKLCAAILGYLKDRGVSYITCISTPEGMKVYEHFGKKMDGFAPYKL